MFVHNKWYEKYISVTTKAKTRGLDKSKLAEATEIHHIIPRSFGGSDDNNNLVLLTLKEHFVCHHLLTKCVVGEDLYKIKHAYAQMINCGKYTSTARQYEIARKIYAEGGRSLEWRENISKGNKGKKRTAEYIEKMRKRLTGRKLSETHRQNVIAASKRRGVPKAAREARLKTLVKSFEVIFPDGTNINVINLKEFCRQNGWNHPTAANNSKTNNPVKRGPLKGYNFRKLC